MDNLIPWLQGLTFWHWMVLGVALVIVELLMPGIWFLWLGLGALATGLVVLVAEQTTWQYQITIFCALSVASIVIGRLVLRRGKQSEDHPMLNRRAAQYVGQTFVLIERTERGLGRVKIGDSLWRVQLGSPTADLPAGSGVVVMAVDGATLRVAPVAKE
jgi:membrane protein implicated in regulation of membrane protease activity